MATLPIKYPALGARFSRLLDQKGWTTTQVAALAGPEGKGVTFATISRIRKGQTRPRPALLARLAEILEVPESEIVGDDAPLSRKREKSNQRFAEATAPAADVPPRPNTLEWKMARIRTVRKLISDADALKPELKRLCEEVAAELCSIGAEADQSL